MPVAVLLCGFQVGAVVAVEVLEDAVLVLQAALAVDGGGVLDRCHGADGREDIRGAAGGGGAEGRLRW